MNGYEGEPTAPESQAIIERPRHGAVKNVLRRVRMLLMPNRYRFISVGRDFYMGSGCLIRKGVITVGDYSFIGNNCHLTSRITIGNWVMLASQVSIVGGDHNFLVPGVPSIWAGDSGNKEVVIEDDVWIGHGATIMHGVHIHEGAVIAAGAVVTKDVESYTVVGGFPAKKIRDRFSAENREKHRSSLENLRCSYTA